MGTITDDDEARLAMQSVNRFGTAEQLFSYMQEQMAADEDRPSEDPRSGQGLKPPG